MDNNSTIVFGLSPFSVAILGIVVTAALLLAYHLVVVRCCNPRETIISHQQMPQHTMVTFEDLPSSLENSITELIPTYKYTKDIGLVSNFDDVTCAICLCEFKDGEVIRVLPECLHSFHVPCIDMWLHSHSNCPLCRADTPLHHRPESDAMRLPDFNQSWE